MSTAVGVDIGGTKIAIAVCDADGAVVERVKVATPDDAVRLVDVVAAEIHKLRDSHSVDAVGVGVAGFVARDHAVLLAPNLPWLDRDLGRHLSDRLGLAVAVENDGNAAAWGEYRFGAGRGVDDQLLITVGTGIGGGLVLDGQLYRGAHGVAAEIGHLQVVEGGRTCGCGQHGCWETYGSGNALTALVRERLAEATAGPLADLLGPSPDKLSGPMVTQAARDGDRVALDALAETGHWLGIGLAGLCIVLDPALVLVGGGVSEAGDLLLDPLRTTFHERLSGGERRPRPDVQLAALGNDAGMIGAADLARLEASHA